MPAKKAAAKKKKKTGSTKKTAGRSSRKAAASRTATASRRKVTKRAAKSSGKTAKRSAKKSSVSSKKSKVSAKKAKSKKGTSKKGTSKKTSTKKAAAGKKKAATRKSSSKKTRPVSQKKVVAKPASSKKRTSSKSAASRNSATAGGPQKTITVNHKLQTATSVLFGPVRGFTPYQPKRGEPYMSDAQLEHFRGILLAWKRELMEEVDRTVLHMKDDAANFPDPNDRATQESEFGLELRTRDRERKLLKKIDSALARIEDRSYGYCEETGDEIGLRRLEARPVATLCVEAQERRELAERQFRDREDYYR